jgi:hypothetical protein
LSSIPQGSTITSATLYLYERDEKLGQVTYIYKVTSDWTENSVTWNSPWLNPGGDFDNSNAYASFLPNQTNCMLVINLTDLVQEWVAGAPNYGFMLYSTGPNHILRYSSKENSVIEQHPKLSITYTQSASLSIAPSQNAGISLLVDNPAITNLNPISLSQTYQNKPLLTFTHLQTSSRAPADYYLTSFPFGLINLLSQSWRSFTSGLHEQVSIVGEFVDLNPPGILSKFNVLGSLLLLLTFTPKLKHTNK